MTLQLYCLTHHKNLSLKSQWQIIEPFSVCNLVCLWNYRYQFYDNFNALNFLTRITLFSKFNKLYQSFYFSWFTFGYELTKYPFIVILRLVLSNLCQNSYAFLFQLVKQVPTIIFMSLSINWVYPYWLIRHSSKWLIFSQILFLSINQLISQQKFDWNISVVRNYPKFFYDNVYDQDFRSMQKVLFHYVQLLSHTQVKNYVFLKNSQTLLIIHKVCSWLYTNLDFKLFCLRILHIYKWFKHIIRLQIHNLYTQSKFYLKILY